jgi:hypothetical protein
MLAVGLGMITKMRLTHRELPAAGMVKLAVNLLVPLRQRSQGGRATQTQQGTVTKQRRQQQQRVVVLVGSWQHIWTTTSMITWRRPCTSSCSSSSSLGTRRLVGVGGLRVVLMVKRVPAALCMLLLVVPAVLWVLLTCRLHCSSRRGAQEVQHSSR